ncbi:MAG: hypothetical protein KAX19_10250 [Candidatus Brocadiae bacterium]|nr:hypothetical protein [Candidatus Brocadiia bacterium]
MWKLMRCRRFLTAALLVGGFALLPPFGVRTAAADNFPAEWDAGWELATAGGAAAQFTVDPTPRLDDGPCARVTVQRPTFTGWQIFLRSRVDLEGGKRYRVSFAVVADGPGALEVCLQAPEPPYRILQLAEVEAGPEPRAYSFLTPPVPRDGPVRLGFWFGSSPKGTYWLDKVSVEELSAEEMSRLERLPEGFENGDFASGAAGWELRTHHGTIAEFSIDPEAKFADGNCARVTVAKATDTSWHVQFMQIFEVVEGKRYLATFSAAADAPGPMPVSFQVPPPDNETLSAETVTVTTEPQAFAVTSARTKRASGMKLSLHMSATGERTFWIDKVCVEALPEDE